MTGERNTGVGFLALSLNPGNKNIAVGYRAGSGLTSGNNNIYIGNQGASVESQTIRVGTAQTSTYVAGINNAGVNGTAVLADANGRLGITLSSAPYKQDIEAMASRSEGLLKLRPVTFVYKDDGAADTLGTYCWRVEFIGNQDWGASSFTNTTTQCFTVEPVPPPAPLPMQIPTLSQWTMILLTTVLLIAGAAALHRRAEN